LAAVALAKAAVVNVFSLPWLPPPENLPFLATRTSIRSVSKAWKICAYLWPRTGFIRAHGPEKRL
jgi:hypothetical protein